MTAHRSLGLVALVVREYDEALDFFVGKLGFSVVEDTYIPEKDKRWVVIRPAAAGASAGAHLLLARASTPEQAARIGDQTGGRVFLFLFTDNLARDHQHFTQQGVVFVREPQVQPHGTVAVFEDLYGNAWDLIEPNAANRSWGG